MSKLPPPRLLSFLICDQVITDIRTKKQTIVGIYENISAHQYPARHPKLTLYAQFSNGRGSVKGRVRVTKIGEEEKEIFSIEGPIVFKDIREVKALILDINGFVFPEEGEYRFQMYVDDDFLDERRIICRKINLQNKGKENGS